MKVYLSKPRYHWISPYTIIEKVVFWREVDYDEPMVKFWNKGLEPLCQAWQRLLDFVHPEICYVKIDRWDTWSMDASLSTIILPMLKQLKATKHGAPNTDDVDVPEELRSTSASPKINDWDTDENWFKRWDWILDEMIWSFEQLNIDWNAQFFDGSGENHQFDKEGCEKHSARIDNGLRLFGKYYRALWN
jgi:hypothetical protein